MLIMKGCKNLHMAIVLQDRRGTESDSDIDIVKSFNICAKD
jgi:hypothetical protein